MNKFGFFILFVLFIGIMTISCSSDKEEETITYYVESGGISVGAWNVISSDPNMTAKDAWRACGRYPVINDPYKGATSGVSRARLEKDLDEMSIDVSGFVKAQFLRVLDDNGAIFQMIDLINGDSYYLYVEKE